MPLYEYKCDKCGHSFEKLVFQGDKEVRCPQCHSEVHKLMSPFNYEIPDEICGRLPKGQERELCTECRQGGSACPMSV